MSVLEDLKRQRGLFVRSPCGHAFRVSSAGLFDATKTLSPAALERLAEIRADTMDLRDELTRRKNNATKHAKIVAKAVNIGKVVEKIAPSLPGFPVRPEDCRSLFEPIDYVVFRGLGAGAIEAIEFVDVKSGNARLQESQREIKRAVDAGRVSLFIASAVKEEAA